MCELFILTILCHSKQQKYPQFNATFSGSLLRRESQYPTDVFDALMLTLKETAGDCNLDLFVQVCSSLHLKKKGQIQPLPFQSRNSNCNNN